MLRNNDTICSDLRCSYTVFELKTSLITHSGCVAGLFMFVNRKSNLVIYMSAVKNFLKIPNVNNVSDNNCCTLRILYFTTGLSSLIESLVIDLIG